MSLLKTVSQIKCILFARSLVDSRSISQYEAERRKYAKELIAFDKWYSEGFSVKSRARLMEQLGSDVALPGPFECVA